MAKGGDEGCAERETDDDADGDAGAGKLGDGVGGPKGLTMAQAKR
jgi:hypothetical protein